MPCFVVIIALAFPRLALLLVYVFSNYLGRAYDSVLWPLLGFFFLPLTTLAYAWAINAHGSVEGLYFAGVLVAALVDLGVLGGGEARRRRHSRC